MENSASAAQNVLKSRLRAITLTGELTLEGTNEYSLSVFGLGTGFISGYMVAQMKKYILGRIGTAFQNHAGSYG